MDFNFSGLRDAQHAILLRQNCAQCATWNIECMDFNFSGLHDARDAILSRRNCAPCANIGYMDFNSSSSCVTHSILATRVKALLINPSTTLPGCDPTPTRIEDFFYLLIYPVTVLVTAPHMDCIQLQATFICRLHSIASRTCHGPSATAP